METKIFTRELQDFNAAKFAYYYGNGKDPEILRFEKEDSVGFLEDRPIFIDVYNKVHKTLANVIKSFNSGDFETVMASLEIIRDNRPLLSQYLFKVVHGVIRTFDTEKFGDSEMTLDYYIYRLIEVSLMNNDITIALAAVSFHITALLKNCIESNATQTFKIKKFIPKNIYSVEKAKLANALMKLGIPTKSVRRRIEFDTAFSVRVSKKDIYKYSTVIISILYSMPGTGWAKKYCAVDLNTPALVFSNQVGEPLDSLTVYMKGYSSVEKVLVLNKIMKSAFLTYILTGQRINLKNLNILYRKSKDPGEWRIVNMITSQFITQVISEETDIMPQKAILDMIEEIDSIFKQDGIMTETLINFQTQYVYRFRLWREFIYESDTISALGTISESYVSNISERINGLLAWSTTAVH